LFGPCQHELDPHVLDDYPDSAPAVPVAGGARRRHVDEILMIRHSWENILVTNEMTLFWAKLVWGLGVIGWFVIRQPHVRRSRRTPKLIRNDRARDRTRLAFPFTGMCLIPGIYALTGQPEFADHHFQQALAWLGAVIFALSLWLFYRTHKELGRNWSVTLEIRERHTLVTSGVYRHVRHPMYSAFWLWALAQALLLPNWIAGLSGLVGFGILFFLRVGHEEELMIETFGDDYRRYMTRTSRVVPGIY
jgi:protein-S-isoprenylcysteine O-methyltransferase Ste14